jgi:hypothetical protein
MKKLFVKIKIIFFNSKFDKNLLVKDPLMQGQKLGKARGGGGGGAGLLLKKKLKVFNS